MILEFEAYDAYDELLPRQQWDVQSHFQCDVKPYVCGVWVKIKPTTHKYPNQVIPLYLTREQLDQHARVEAAPK
jgi:hypothetical protein